MSGKATRFFILSHDKSGGLRIQTDKGVTYDYGGATDRDISMIQKFVKKGVFEKAWQIINKLSYCGKSEESIAEELDRKSIQQNLFEHVMDQTK